MKDWKELKDKEIIIGLIIIIILGIIALSLLIKREVRYQKDMPVTMEEGAEMSDFSKEEISEEVYSEPVVTEEVQEEAALEEDLEEELALANVQIVTEETSKQIAEDNKKQAGLYDILGNEKYAACSLTERKHEDNQLKELYDYWDAYKLDAVADLVRLERMQKISEELEGTNKFYYYGSVDRLGRPSGKGLAVYEDNTYYCGEWKEGLRHGKGMWLEVAIYTEDNANLNRGVIEHSYNGQWSKDLPNGEGQEHFSYDYDILTEDDIDGEKCIANVIGGFKDGYYHGEMYIMTVDERGKSTDWSGTCKDGAWVPIEVGYTSDTVWQTYEKDEQGSVRCHYLLPNENHNYGIMGLKK